MLRDYCRRLTVQNYFYVKLLLSFLLLFSILKAFVFGRLWHTEKKYQAHLFREKHLTFLEPRTDRPSMARTQFSSAEEK